MRLLSVSLRPQLLDDLGLNVALKWLVGRYRHSSPARLRFELDPRIQSMVSSQAAITIYRIIQESLTNAAKHARAKSIRISLRARTHDILLTVHDDGVGFDAEKKSPTPSTGLSGMRERVALLGGAMEIHSRPGSGTSIRCVVPAATPRPMLPW